jgi:hypothetical protein
MSKEASFRWGDALGRVFGFLLTLASIAALFAAVHNVFGSSIEVDRLAREAACQGIHGACSAQFTRWERTPIAHTLDMHTPRGSKLVECQREHILFGPWSCAVGGAGPASSAAPPIAAAPSATAAPSASGKGKPAPVTPTRAGH